MVQLEINFQFERRATPRVVKPHFHHTEQEASAPEDVCLIRLKDVLAICGKSRSSIYEAIRKGEFPAPVKLYGNSSAWIKSEVLQWAHACIHASRAK